MIFNRSENHENPQSLRNFVWMATTLAFPLMIQNLISTLVNTADTLMLGYVSQTAMSASSLANHVYMVLWMALNGFSTGASVLAAQYWGKKDTITIEKVLGLAIKFSCIVALVFSIIAMAVPDTVMSIFTNDSSIVAEGATYLRIIAISYVFSAFSMAYFAVLRSVEKVILPSVVFVCSLGINILVNATFIFGLFGLPKLGLVGVAVGTVAARVFEALTCFCHTVFSKDIKFRIKYLVAGSRLLLGDYLRISMPALINDVAWGLSATVYAMVLGHMGSDAVAAEAVVAMIVNIGAICCRGFANATTIIIGKVLGQDKKELAKIYARRMLILTFVVSALGGVVIILMRPLAIMVYEDKLTEQALRFLGIMLLMSSYRLIGEGLNTCWICGCFRGGGDAKFGMVVDTLCIWLMAVPFTLIAAYVIKLPVVWVYFVMCLDEFEKMIPVYIHYRGYKWLNNITRDSSEV